MNFIIQSVLNPDWGRFFRSFSYIPLFELLHYIASLVLWIGSGNITMIEALLVILIILWFLGYITVPGLIIPDIVLFSINNHPITLWNIFVLIILSWIVGILPSPFREIATVFGVLWILSVIGILAIGGFSQLFVIAIIFGLVFYIFSGKTKTV